MKSQMVPGTFVVKDGGVHLIPGADFDLSMNVCERRKNLVRY